MFTDIVSRQPINSHTALSTPAYWRAMEFLSSNLASFGRAVFKDGAATDEDHPLTPFLKRSANATQPAHRFWKTFFFHGEHYGNGYAYVRRTSFASSQIASLHNLLPEDVTPFRLIPDGGTEFDAEIWYYHRPSKTAFASADVLHYMAQASHDGLIAYSPTQLMASVFKRADSLEKYNLKYLDKGTMIKGSIEFPAGTTKEQATEVITALKEFRATTGDKDIIALIGGAKLNNATISATDSRTIEQDEALTKKISQITGVPPQFLYEQSESKYNNNAEQAGQDVVRFVFRTRIENIEDELTFKLLTREERDAGYTIKLNADALQRGDTKTQTEVVAAQVASGLATKNEGREELGRPADSSPESDQLLTPHSVASAPAPAKGGDAAD